MSKELLNALDALETEKGIKKEVIIDALEQALVSAYKKNYGQAQNVKVTFDARRGDIKVFAVKEVVNEVLDSCLEVSLADALEINRAYEIGDTIDFEVTPRDFGRIAAQTAKQVIMQRVREEERQMIYNQYSRYENEIMTGEVERRDSRYVYVNLGNVEAVLSKRDRSSCRIARQYVKGQGIRTGREAQDGISLAYALESCHRRIGNCRCAQRICRRCFGRSRRRTG